MDSASNVFDETLDSSIKEEEFAAKRYKTFFLIRDPFWTGPITPDDDVQELFVNRVEEAKELAHFLASIMRGEESNLAMIGPEGLGKTSLLTLVFNRLTEYQEKPRVKTSVSRKLKSIAEMLDLIHLPICAFDRTLENELATMIEEQMEEDEEKLMLLLIEFCDHEEMGLLEQLNPLKPTFRSGKREDTLYSAFFNTYEKLKDVAPFIGSINTFAWALIRQEYQDVYKTFFSPEKCKVLIIKPLEESQISDLLKKRIYHHRTGRARRKYKDNPYPFTEDAISLTAKSSEGFPSISLELAGRSLEKALKTNADIIDEYIVEAENFSFPRIRGQVDELDASQEQVLKTILGLGGSASATMIEKYVDVSRPAIIAIMKKLDELKMIERKPTGRAVMFNLKMGVREAWETRLQNKLEIT